MHYYPAYICENGHVAEASSYRFLDKFCTQCGSPIIHLCPSCNERIDGLPQGCSGHFHAPSYCANCGKPFPWTEKAIVATLELLAEDDALTTEECNRLSDTLPDIMTETPRTQLAAARLRKALLVVGSVTGDALRQFVVEYGCAAIKTLLGL